MPQIELDGDPFAELCARVKYMVDHLVLITTSMNEQARRLDHLMGVVMRIDSEYRQRIERIEQTLEEMAAAVHDVGEITGRHQIDELKAALAEREKVIAVTDERREERERYWIRWVVGIVTVAVLGAAGSSLWYVVTHGR